MYISKRKRSRISETQKQPLAVEVCEADGSFSSDQREMQQTPDTPLSQMQQPTEPPLSQMQRSPDPSLSATEQLTPNSMQKLPTDDPAANETVPQDPQQLQMSPVEGEEVSYEQFLSDNTESGVLRVQATAGTQSIPLSNVNVTVYKDFSDGRHVFYTVTTNSDGVADSMVLPAPPRDNSVIGNGESAYADYSVSADREGMRGVTVENVPVFSGVKSIQPLILTNLPTEV